MKTGEQKVPRYTEEVQASPREPCACTQEGEEREFPAEELLLNHGHTLLSYCGPDYSQTSTTTATESDSGSPDTKEEDNGDNAPPRRHFKTVKSEPCKYNFSILPHSKSFRAVHKKDFVPSSSKDTVASKTTVFDFPDSQVHNDKQKITHKDNTGASRAHNEQQVQLLTL